MKKLVVFSLVTLSIFSCKNKSAEEVSNENSEPSTYAELSIAQGGTWIDGSRGHKEYDGGTSFKNVDTLVVPKQHTDHSWYIRYEGPGWENSNIGYRLYLDWRNAIDIFGKKVDTLVLPYVGQDGFDSYHEPSPWGQDILKAGKSLGIGGYGRIVADTMVHFQKVKNTYASVKNNEASSTVNIWYDGWESGNDTINLKSQLTIYPEDRFTKVSLTPSRAIPGICTGIVKFKTIPLIKKEGEKWAYIATYGKQDLASPPDNLGLAIFYRLDDVSDQKDGDHDHLVIFKPTDQPSNYYLLGAWEQEPESLKTKEDFLKDLNDKLILLDKSNTLTLQ